MDIFTAASRIPRIITAGRDLAAKINELHDSPKFKELMASDPTIKKLSEDISRDARTIQEALR